MVQTMVPKEQVLEERVGSLEKRVDKGFDEVDKHFEEVRADIRELRGDANKLKYVRLWMSIGIAGTMITVMAQLVTN